MSVLITFEGGDGSGKSTQAALLHGRLIHEGYDAVLLQEPGSTALGTYLRDWLKRESDDTESLAPVSELLLFIAARAQLVSEVIKPALDQPDAVVICDRYIDSTVAYQGYGRGLDVGMVDGLNAVAIDGTVPDLTFLIDVPPTVALERIDPQAGPDGAVTNNAIAMRDEQGGMRRFEEEGTAFHEAVYRGYAKLTKEESERWRVVDGVRPKDEIANEIRALTTEVLLGIAMEAVDEKPPLDPSATDDEQDDSSQPSLF